MKTTVKAFFRSYPDPAEYAGPRRGSPKRTAIGGLLNSVLALCLSAGIAEADALTREAQQLLTRLGHDVGGIDGSYGARTAAAISAFLKERGREYDGTLDDTDISALKSAAVERGIRLTPLAGYEIENADDGLLYGPDAPGLTRYKYAFGFFWTRADWNRDGIGDFIYTGTMIAENAEATGEDTGGACGGDTCAGEMPGPTLYLGKADGTFIEASHLIRDERAEPGQSLARQDLVADFNADGVLDLFIADHAIGTHLGIRDSYFLSQPDGTWLESSESHLSDPNYRIFDHGGATGDIDNDGDMDIVLTELRNRLTCWMNDGAGHMTKRNCGNINAFGIELGDMDGDGDLDLVHAGHEHEGSTPTGIALNDGSGRFERGVRLEQIEKWSTVPEVAVWDLDGDADLDIVTSRAGKLYVGTGIQVLENMGGMTFRGQFFPLVEAPADYVPTHEGNEWNNFVGDIRFADVDKDGDSDVLLVGGGWNENAKRVRAAILRNEGGMTFTHIPNGSPGNPVVVLEDALFKEDPEKVRAVAEAEAAKKLAVVSGGARETDASSRFENATRGQSLNTQAKFAHQPLEEPILFEQSGASVVAAGNVEAGIDWITYDLTVEWAGSTFPVSVCVEYYRPQKFMANRINFVGGEGFGGLESLQAMGTNACRNQPGYAGTWELPPEATDYGLDVFLGDLERNGLGLVARLPGLDDEERQKLIGLFSAG